jgi:hypothetical protein
MWSRFYSRLALLCGIAALTGCGPRKPVTGAGAPENPRVPLFATQRWEPFRREDAVAIAQREWRLFGSPVDDASPAGKPDLPPELRPERMPGLWQRVGEYWWTGLNPGDAQSAWTGLHDEHGNEYDPARDGNYAWSAAFISYVMRIAGAGPDFPYAASHSVYINAAASGANRLVTAFAPSAYAPRLGDLICLGRSTAAHLIFADLPTADNFPGHCDIVIDHLGQMLTVVGGNVDDAVTAKHVPVTADGKLADAGGISLDARYNWLTVIRVNYSD